MSISVGDCIMKAGIDLGDWNSGMQRLNTDLKTLQEKSKSTALAAAELTKVGVGLTAFGGSIAGILGLAAKGAADDEAAFIRLSSTLKNVGVDFSTVKGDLDKFITGLEKTTAVSQDKLYPAFTQLVSITKDYEKAQKLLPIALDLAAHAGIDLASATDIVSKASQGVARNLAVYGISVREGASATEILSAIQRASAGEAEAYGKSTQGAIAGVKNALGELMDSIGAVLLPALKAVANIVKTVIDWFNKIPSSLKTALVVFAAVAGGASLICGSILIWIGLLPKLRAAWAALNAVMSMNVFGLIVTAIGLVITAGIALWKNWDKVKNFFLNIWSELKQKVYENCLGMLDALSAFSQFIPGLNSKVDQARAKLRSLIDAEKITRDARNAGVAISGDTEAMKKATEAAKAQQQEFKNLTAAQANLTTELTDAESTLDQMDTDYQHVKDNAAGYRDELKQLELNLDMNNRELKESQDKLQDIEGDYRAAGDAVADWEQKISDANDELQRLLRPKLVGMQASEDAIQAIQEQIDLLELQKLKEGELYFARQDELDALYHQRDILEAQAKVDFDPILYDLQRAAEEAQGLNTEMAPEDVFTRISELGKQLGADGELQVGLKEAHARLDTIKKDFENQQTVVNQWQAAVDQSQIALDALNLTLKTIYDEWEDNILKQKNLVYDLGVQIADTQTALDNLNSTPIAPKEQVVTQTFVPAPGTNPTSEQVAAGSTSAWNVEPEHLQTGGIVKKPLLAMLGEQAPHNPEVVAPLDKLLSIFQTALKPLGTMALARTATGGDIYYDIDVNNPIVRDQTDIDKIGQSIVDKIRLRQGLKV